MAISDTVQIALVLLTGVYVLLTGAYVLLTHKILRETRHANSRQFQLTCLPHLFCSARPTPNGAELSVSNAGSMPAIDVEMLVLGIVDQEELPPQEFLRLYVKDRDRPNRRLTATEDGFYAIYDHPVYPYFPPKRQVKIPISYPVRIQLSVVFLQFRDIIGNNYHRLHWLFQSPGTLLSQRYRLGSAMPMGIAPSPRILVSLGEGPTISTEDGSPLAQHLRADLLPLFACSISAGFLNEGLRDVEDPGEWSDA